MLDNYKAFFVILLFPEINGVVPKEPAAEQAMSTENDAEEITNHVSGLTLQDADTYNPDKVPYEVATFALS